ncbi:MAG: hypothetical protein WCI47_00130 [bacterium]
MSGQKMFWAGVVIKMINVAFLLVYTSEFVETASAAMKFFEICLFCLAAGLGWSMIILGERLMRDIPGQ